MGQWTTDYKSKKEILPKPQTEIQKWVHIFDYLGSRKWIEVDFEDDYYDGSYKPHNEVDDIIPLIISECKNKITNGVDRNKIYASIEEIAKVKNPNKILNADVAKLVLENIKKLN